MIQTEVSKLSVTKSSRRTSPVQPWVTPGLLRSINTRNTLLKEFLKERSAEKLKKFKKYRNVLRLAMRRAKQVYYRSQFSKNAGNPKRLWGDLLEAINKRKAHVDLTNSFEINNSVVSSPEAVARQFNDYYSQIAPTLDAALGPCSVDPLSYLSDVRVPETLVFRPVGQEAILDIVTSLKDTGAGLDGINSKLLKQIIPVIVPHLAHLVNICIMNGTFPAMLKTALITPIYKTGSRSLFSNYRPISVLPVISKILESVIYNQLLVFLTENEILFDYQFGFRASHSTYMPICLLHDLITSNLVNGYSTAGIYLDLARAFDTVNTKIFLSKLSKYGIRGNALALFSSYLHDRKQCLKYKNVVSDLNDITCGVPQGSVLGPILFLLYINDLPGVCNEAKFFLFADDTAIFYSAHTLRELQLAIAHSFPKVVLWLHANRLSLSTSKTFYQLYAPGNAENTGLSIPVKGINLKRAPIVKYLGLLVDEDLKFKSHINKVSGVISRNLGIISRARYLLNRKLLILLYNSLVLPYLSYCLIIWGSNYESNLNPIVIAQKRAIRLIAGVGRLSHTSPLFRELKLLKVPDLLNKQLLLLMHNYVFGRLPAVLSEKFSLHNHSRPSRSIRHFSESVTSGTGDVVPNYRLTNYRLFSPICRAPKTWNLIIATRIPDLQNVPPSSNLFKKCVMHIFLDDY